MRNIVYRLIYTLWLFLIVLLLTAIFLLTTTPGLQTSLTLIPILLGKHLEIQGASGRLLSDLYFKHLSYTSGPWRFDMENIRLTPHLIAPLGLDFSATLMKTTYKHHTFSIPLTLTGTCFSLSDATMHVRLPDSVYALPPNSPIPKLSYHDGHLTVKLTPTGLDLSGSLLIFQHTTARLNLQLPGFRFGKTISSLPLQGSLDLNLPTLDLALEETPPFKGLLHAHMTLAGTLKAPALTSTVELSKGRLALPEIGLLLAPINVKIASHGTHWTAAGALMSHGRAFRLQGQGRLTPTPTGLIHLTGDQVLLLQTPEYKISTSPALSFQLTPQGLQLQGEILVPQAELKPLSFSNTVILSDDVVFVQKKPIATAVSYPFPLSTIIQIRMGKQVSLDIKGLHGFLDGMVTLKQSTNGPLTAEGALSIREGRYQAYGQHLTVDEGRLLFTGTSLDNPLIELKALRTVTNTPTTAVGSNLLLAVDPAHLTTSTPGQKTTVGVLLSGRLKEHKITLFSIPPGLPASDILSLLILGTPANQASKSGGQLLLAAVSSMNLDSGTDGLKLLTQLKQTLGIDLDIKTNTRYVQGTNQSTDNTGLVLGKALSKRLYLSYNIGLLQKDINVLTLKYLLNAFFSLQVTTSDSGNGVDLLYTH